MTRPFLPEVTETAEAIRVAWDMRRAPRSRAHLLLILLTAPFMAVVGSAPVCVVFVDSPSDTPAPPGWMLVQTFAAVSGVLFWVLTALAVYDLLGRRWAEWVEITPRTITVGRRGFLAPRPKVVPVGPGAELFFGVREDHGDPREAAIQLPGPASLEVVGAYSSWGWRTWIDVGRWLPGPAKEKVFQALAAFITSRTIPVTVTRTAA